MGWNQFMAAFAALFLAELGDKTQLVVITMSASSKRPIAVFLGGSLALVLLTGLGAIAGEAVTKVVPEWLLRKSAALLFVAIGIWTWFKS
jgi:Ca2+/H+ antiporter, TMEM165/GDT1 family